MLILGILQNAHSFRAASRGYKVPIIYKLDNPGWNLKNATYSRIKKIFYNNQEHDCWLSECSRNFGQTKADKFETDKDHIEKLLKLKNWDLIICFGKQAENALKNYSDKFKIINVPHPTSYKWRKTIIGDIQNEIQ